MKWKAKPATTKQAWLDELGRRLVWFFPITQVKDILSDYREQFDAGHDHCKTETEIIQGLGTPAEAAALLLEEEPAAKLRCYRQSGLWGAALALCWSYLWVCLNTYYFGFFWVGTFLFIPLAASALFLLLRGPARVELEGQYAPEKTVSPVSAYYAPFALLLLFEAVEQIFVLLYRVSRLPAYMLGMDIGEANTWFILALEAGLGLLLAWLIFRSVTVSIWYFPGIVHTVGAMGAAFFTYIYLHSYYITNRSDISIDLLLRLLPYCVGLATALVFRQWVDGRRPLPRFFRDGPVTWREWLHRLGVSLLGWFPAEQTLEILEDYREQYELGREQGKSEELLLSEMGRPDAVVRDLLAEDRKARLRRRKAWCWAVPVAFAGWLLLGLMRTYEFGAVGFGWKFNYYYAWQVGVTVTLLGTASLFVPFHVRARISIEERFPPSRRPTIWVYLLPLAFSALVEGLAVYLLYTVEPYRDVMFLGRPLRLYMVSIIEFSVLLLLFLLIWILVRCTSGSIRYFAAVPHILGSVCQALCSGIYLSAMDVEYLYFDRARTLRNFLPSLRPYLVGAVLSLAVWLFIRFAGKPRKEG